MIHIDCNLSKYLLSQTIINFQLIISSVLCAIMYLDVDVFIEIIVIYLFLYNTCVFLYLQLYPTPDQATTRGKQKASTLIIRTGHTQE